MEKKQIRLTAIEQMRANRYKTYDDECFDDYFLAYEAYHDINLDIRIEPLSEIEMRLLIESFLDKNDISGLFESLRDDLLISVEMLGCYRELFEWIFLNSEGYEESMELIAYGTGWDEQMMKEFVSYLPTIPPAIKEKWIEICEKERHSELYELIKNSTK